MENKTRFEKWYRDFLLSSGQKEITEETAQAEAEQVKQLIPNPDEIAGLTDSTHCKFCKSDIDVKPADGIACTDLGNIEPKSRTNELFNNKGGSILPICAPICPKCRRNFRLVQLLPTLVSVFIVAVALICLAARGLGIKAMVYKWDLLIVTESMRPFLVFAVVVIIAMAINYFLKRLLVSKLDTRFDVFDIPGISGLKDKGWFKLHGNKHCCEMMFADLPHCDCGCEHNHEEVEHCDCGCEHNHEEAEHCDCGCEHSHETEGTESQENGEE